MLFSVLTKKSKVPRLNFHLPRSRSWLREGAPAQACSSRTQSGSSCQCPDPAKETDLNWWHAQCQVPRPCPAIFSEGVRCPGHGWPSGFSMKLGRIISIGATGIYVVVNTNQVNSQLTIAPLYKQPPKRSGTRSNNMQYPCNFSWTNILTFERRDLSWW